MPTRAGHAIGTRALSAVVVHSAPLVLPVCERPIEDGAVAVRGDRVIRVGPRGEIEAAYPESAPTRWPGMIVPGLVDAHLRLDQTPVRAAVHGVTAIAGVAGDPDVASAVGETGLGGVTYLETRCENEARWEGDGRDRLITAIREVDHPGAIGIAPHSPDPVVMEDLAILSRTFRLRLLIEVGRHPAAFLDEVGALGPGCHVAVSGPLDEADRKLLRIRGTAVAISSPFAAEGLLDGGGVIAFGTRTGGDPLAVARTLARDAADDTAGGSALDRLLVEAVTLGGARALGMAEGTGRLGSLGPGSRADFAVFAVKADERTAYTALLREGPGRCVATIIGGRPRWRLGGGHDVEARRLA
ncbi:amidohydrolase family protein [Streptosporangium sp. CA-135522]|uniref:amidohydrolase family protein n=1 Tax=Streptosporangium sp. CA-135522 TaxID=3240072 RepID=UPI003D8E5FB8